MSERPADPFASSAARDRAAELGLSADEIDGSGREGRITVADVERYLPPAPPEHLGEAGARLWERIIAALPAEAEFDARELEAIDQACATRDLIEELQTGLREDGLYITGANRQKKQHPFLAEIRQQRLALVRMLGTLGLPGEDELAEGGNWSGKSERARKAARARWGHGPAVNGDQGQLLGAG